MQVNQCLRGVPTPFLWTDKDTASEDKKPAHPHMRRAMKSGKIHTKDSYVTRQVRWPHEMVFTAHGKPPVYSDIALHFSQTDTFQSVVTKEYIYVHLQELMEDVEVYVWRVVKKYDAASFQPMEQGRAAWGDASKKEKLR